MATSIEMITAPSGGGFFQGLSQKKDGEIIGTYVADEPYTVCGGDVLFVEITDADRAAKRCRVVSYVKQPGYYCQNKEDRAKASHIPYDVMHQDELDYRLSISQMAQSLLSLLSGRDAEIIRRRFFDEEELKIVGKSLGISGDRVRQIEARALRMLKNEASKRGYWGAYRETIA